MIVPFDETRLVIFENLHWIATVLSCLLNLILMYLILTKTKERLRSYAVILFSTCLCDLLIGIFAGLTMMRTISAGSALVLISHGPCRFYGWQACISAEAALQTSTTFSIILIPMSFWYRDRVLTHTAPKFRTMVISCVTVAAPLIIFGSSPEEQLREALRIHNFTIFPNDRSLYVIQGFQDVFRTKALIHITIICCCPFPCLSIGMYYRRRIMKTLTDNAFSARTKKLQENLVAALTFQCCVTLIFVSIATIFLWRQLELPFYDVPPYFEELVFLGLSLVTVINPVITGYFVLPYRNAVLAIFPRYRRKIIHTATSTDTALPDTNKTSEY